MGILALNKRLVDIIGGLEMIAETEVPKRAAVGMRLVLAYALHRGLHGVHLAEQVARLELCVGLIVNRTGLVYLQNLLLHLGEGVAVAGLVAERPEEDTGVVLIAVDHIAHAIAALGSPMRIAARDARGKAVSFEVVLAHDENTYLVAQLIEAARVRIVAGTHVCYVAVFEQLEIASYNALRHGMAVIRMEIVSG